MAGKKQPKRDPSSDADKPAAKLKRKTENSQKSDNEDNTKKYMFWAGLILFFLLVGYMKMKEENYRKFAMTAGKDVITDDLYKVMDLKYNVAQDKVKEQYKIMAKELHPDKNPNCEDCKEKFEKLAKAYEILGDEEKRKFYDTTNTSMNVIKSTTMSLNYAKWKQMVENSSDTWIIMIYINDSACENFTQFWDDASKTFPFIKFGRINATYHTDLLPSLPFRAEEYPFVFNMQKGKVPEFLEFNMEKPSPTELKKFVQNSIDVMYKEVEHNALVKHLRSPKDGQGSVTALVRTRVSTAFTYLAAKTSEYNKYYTTKLSDHAKTIKFLGVNNASYIIKFPSHMSYAEKSYITVDFERNEAAHMTINNLVKFMAIPSLGRYSYLDFCGDTEVKTKDHFSDSDMPTLCIMALKENSKDYHMSLVNYFREKQSELVSKYVIAARKQEHNVWDRLKNIQFATVQLEQNKLLANFIKSTGVQNPKALIYLTVEERFAVVNNLEDLVDLVDDILDGSATSLKNFKETTGDEAPLNQYFTPDDMGFFSLMMKHILSFFDSFKYFVMYGVSLFLVQKYAKVEPQHSGSGLLVLILITSVWLTLREGRENGLFI